MGPALDVIIYEIQRKWWSEASIFPKDWTPPGEGLVLYIKQALGLSCSPVKAWLCL